MFVCVCACVIYPYYLHYAKASITFHFAPQLSQTACAIHLRKIANVQHNIYVCVCVCVCVYIYIYIYISFMCDGDNETGMLDYLIIKSNELS